MKKLEKFCIEFLRMVRFDDYVYSKWKITQASLGYIGEDV